MNFQTLRYFTQIPTQQIHYLLYGLFLLLSLGSCSVTKKMPAGESLYVGANINIQSDSVISQKESSVVKAQLEAFVKPKPNSAILGFPYKVWFYYLFGEPKSDKGFKAFFRKRFGEPPVLANKGVVTANAKQINLLLNNQGYFRSVAYGSLSEKNRKSTANYRVELHERYTVDSIYFSPKDTSAFGKAFVATQVNSLIKQGTPYLFDLINAERERIDNLLKRKGYYYFRPDFIIIKADSSVGKHKVNLSFEVKTSTSQVAKKLYRIRDIHVLADYGEKSKTDSIDYTEINYKGLKVFDRTQSFHPKIFSDAIGFRRGGRYSSTIQDVSLSRLINLNGNFKFVKNTFELVPRSDSALLDVFYHLTPLKAKSVVADLNATTKSNNYTGTNISISWLNKNTFKGAELLKVTAIAGLEFQVGGVSSTIGAVNTTRFSIESSLSLPRFTIPFVSINPTRNQSLPKTNFNIGYEVMKRGGLYDLTSLRTSLSYAWKQNASIEHSFTPLLVNLVKASNFSEDFALEYFRNPILYEEILDNKIIMSSAYTISYMPATKPSSRHNFSFTGGIELAGNLASLLSKLSSNENAGSTVFGVTYPQYARFDADIRYGYRITQNIRLANRLLMGYGLPYGNSYFLPTVKQYVAGGNNSIRAFAARTIGPGSYLRTGSLLEQTIGGQSGDVKLEFNTELRAKFNQYIHGAIFIDAGNVWMQHDVDVYGEDAVFGKDFYKQVAIGTGIGLRLDFSYLVMRFDLATPVRKPYLPENERWVLKDFNLGDAEWRKENLVLNIAIGYPF
jgi:outer membrane protein assembly factor BamA